MSMPTRNPPVDQDIRDESLNPLNSYVVTAPAGSGKTSLLTQRALTLLATVDEPESILCITFTRKAAGEMRDRILHALLAAEQTSQPQNENEAKTWRLAKKVLQRDIESNWQILRNPNRLRVTTIDGFCRSITNQLPLIAGVGLGMKNLELPEQAYQQAARDTLAWLEKPNSVYHSALGTLLSAVDYDTQRLENLFCQLLQKRDQWLSPVIKSRDSREMLEGYSEQLIKDQLQLCHKQLSPFADDIVRLARFSGETLAKEGSESPITKLSKLEHLPVPDINGLSAWRALIELLLTSNGKYRKRFDKSVGIPAGKTKSEKDAIAPIKRLAEDCIAACSSIMGLEDQLALVKLLPDFQFTEEAWQFLAQLTTVLPLLVGHLKTHFSQIDAVDFIEISQSAVTALATENINDVLLRLDNQIQHILVDEFQDTSQVQLDLLTHLTSGWQPGDGRTLFLVGDGMQSCYGFRGAEVGLFLEVKTLGLGDIKLKPLTLTTNFRSQNAIVKWVNTTFSDAFPQQDDIARGAVSFSPAEAFDQKESGEQQVFCHGFLLEEWDKEQRTIEADIIVDVVQATHKQYAGDSIAILVRSRNHLKAINNALQKAHLIPLATEIEPLAQRQAINDLLSLTRFLLRPVDEIAWFALLRAPWVALSPTELLAVANDMSANGYRNKPLLWLLNKTISDLSLTLTTQQRMSQLQSIFRTVWRDRRRKKLRIWIESIWAALAGPTTLLEASDLENVQAFWQLIDQFDRGNSIADWDGFLLAIEQLYAAPATGADPKLQVMTLHKSKGLEFDHVIIPALDKGARGDERALLLWQSRLSHSGKNLLLMAPIDSKQNATEPTLYRFLREEIKIKNRLESIRLLYVGCTRAIKQLHLTAAVEPDEKNASLKLPAANTLLASVWPMFSSQIMMATQRTIDNRSVFADSSINSWHKIRKTETKLLPVIKGNQELEKFRGSEFADENNIPDLPRSANLQARHFGTVLHQLLELIAIEGIEAWSRDRLENHRNLIQYWLRQLGSSDAARQSHDIIKSVEKLLKSPTALWLLNPMREGAISEYSLLDTRQNQSYILDRTFIDQGWRWIIDYKTSRPLPEETLNGFFERESEHYLTQLQTYATLMSQIQTLPIKTALYFPLLDELLLVDHQKD